MKIALVGKMRSGKDTVAAYFVDSTNGTALALGDGIKLVANSFFSEIVEKGKPRYLYQKVGQDFREIDPDVWVKFLHKRLLKLDSNGETSFIITDVRQQNEYEYLKLHGFTVIKVETADELRKERILRSGDVMVEEDFNHVTEKSVDGIPYDYLITNNTSLNDLYAQCQYVLNEMRGI